MLALIYLLIAIYLGDQLCRRFYRFLSIAHRLAAATLVGLLLSSWFTFLAAWGFSFTPKPLLWADLLFFAVTIAAIYFLKRRRPKTATYIEPRPPGSAKWDWLLIGCFVVFASWMMFATLTVKGANLQIANNEWSDFGPNTAIIQSFAVGHNFPTQYPHFAGPPIRYHFLFYFQAGNLEFLGLSLPWSLNLLSILTLVCMLALVMTLGQLLFNSRAVGRIGSALFFCHGSLSFIAFLRGQPSLSAALHSIYTLKDFIPSGYPYRGELWGIWSQVVFLNQRHLASGIGILLLVLIFLFDQYKQKIALKQAERRKRAEEEALRKAEAAPEVAPELFSPPAVDQPTAVSQTTVPGEAEPRQSAEDEPLPSQSNAVSPVPEDAATVSEAGPLTADSTAPAVSEAEVTQPIEAESLPPSSNAVSPVTEDAATVSEAGPLTADSTAPALSETEVSQPIEAESLPQPNLSDPGATEQPLAESPGLAPIAASDLPPRKSFRTRVIELARESVISGRGFLFCGLLLGALPFWNALVFTSAFAVLFCLFLLFPYRGYMIAMALTTALVAFPQIRYLRTGNLKTQPSILHWGYIIDNHPTIGKVIAYVAFIFGGKWLLILLGLLFASWLNKRLFIAFCSLLVLTFCCQFSIEALANHKFLNIWLIIANLFVAYSLWLIWKVKVRGLRIAARVLAIILAIPAVAGGIIDLFPIHNSYWIEMAYKDDPLIKWVRSETKPHDVFLSDRFVNHQILLAGRRIFYGWPSFAWSAGYNTAQRDGIYRLLFESIDPRQVYQLLRDNNISYVAFDEGVRRGNELIRRPNEELYSKNFEKVWEDKGPRYALITIYKIPPVAPKEFKPVDLARIRAAEMNAPAVTMFQGGNGARRGQFDFPRGLTADKSGNIYVADTNNGRIQKFSPAGIHLATLGTVGRNMGEMQEPNGVAIDKDGNIYVTEVGNHRVQKLTAEGRPIVQWKGPEPGFYGPRDVCVTANNFIYVVDQGRSRVVKYDVNGIALAVWGSQGPADGQFNEPTSVGVDEKTERVFVADPRNQRIQVFDPNGKFLSKWAVNEWQATGWAFQHLVIDSKNERLYATSPLTDEVLVFDLQGNRIASVKPKPPDKLEGACGLALFDGKLYVLCTLSNRVISIVLPPK